MGCGSSVLLIDRSKVLGCESSVLLANLSKAIGRGSSGLLVDRSTNTESERPTSSDSEWHQKMQQKLTEIDKIYTFYKGSYPIRPKNNKTGFVYKWVSVDRRRKIHEQLAITKKVARYQLNSDKLEARKIKALGLCPLKIPACNHNDERIRAYTSDTITNIEQKYFKYDKKIYSLDRMMLIIQERMNECEQLKEYTGISCGKYPRYNWMRFVSRKELARILPVCLLGVWVEPPRSEILQRMKEDVGSIFDAPFQSAYSEPGADDSYAEEQYGHFHDQLLRWLTNYPNNIVYNVSPQPNVDPNKQVFPLPKEIQADKTILRKWLEVWEPFDCELPKDGAWNRLPSLNEDWQECRVVFTEHVKTNHEDESLEPFDTTIEGDVPWTEIEMDLVKNDITTKAQDEIWKKRATRRNLNDPVRMAARRQDLADYLAFIYKEKNKPYPVEDFMNFAEVLEKHWKEFQRLCIYYRPRKVQH